jgi:hypothetical protein
MCRGKLGVLVGSRKGALVIRLEVVQFLLELGKGGPLRGEIKARSFDEIEERGTFEDVERNSSQEGL